MASSTTKGKLLAVILTLAVITTAGRLFLGAATKTTATTPRFRRGGWKPVDVVLDESDDDSEGLSFYDKCVMTAFDPPSGPQPDYYDPYDNVYCRGFFRGVYLACTATGRVPPGYVEALKKVPRFKNNSTALNEYLTQFEGIKGQPCME